MCIKIGSMLVMMTISFLAKSQETLLLRHPSISGDKIAFAYGSDIWVANKNGSNPIRLTVNPDVEFNPIISPDGKWVAFSGNYDGNIDVYVVPIEGGSPKRLTWHPGSDVVRSWNGMSVIYASTKESATTRYQKLFAVDAVNGGDEALKMPEATEGTISPDGKFTAYIKVPDPTDGNRAYRPFKLYRGGLMPKVWIFNNATYDVDEVPGSKGNNNTRPVWVGNTIYFLSDRDNKNMNVYSYNTGSKEVKEVTNFKDYDVKTLHSDGKALVFEQGGKIYVLNPGSASQAVQITINADITTKRPHWEDGQSQIRGAGISPTGVRAVFESRGEIFTVPAEKGDVRNLSKSAGANDRSPAWSPDGRFIAWFSDDSGEYQLKLKDQKAEKEEISISLGDKNFYYEPVWSPDSKKILYSDKHLRLYFIDIAERKPVLIDEDSYDRPDDFFAASWSSDNKWIVYNKRLKNYMSAVFVFDVTAKKSYQLTDGRSEANYPAFSRDGKYIFFTASTNYGRSVGWLDMSSYENPVRNSIYAIVLSKDAPSLLAPESDEEAVKSTDTSSSKTPAVAATKAVKIDFEGIDQRIVAMALPERNYSDLSGTADGKIFFVQRDPGAFAANLMTYDIAKRKAEVFMPGVSQYAISADGKKLLYGIGNSYGIVSTAAKPTPADGRLNTSEIKIWVDPVKEWAQMLDEDWRIQRDFFYVENMHGANWPAIKKKYEKFLPYVAHREDLSYLINQMNAELVIGHNYVSQGDYPESVNVNTGLLGADYSNANGYYQFKKIYGTLNWNPQIKAPLTQPGLNIKEGDYLIAVNGVTLDTKTNVYSLFQNTAGKQTRISVNSQPSAQGAKEYTVVPIANETVLRNMHWVEGNRKKVDELSKGRLAYVYLPNTGGDGYTFFNRYYYSQLEKDGVIVDERFNGGGSLADYIIDMLNRKVTNYWKNRDGAIMKTPEAVIDGPMAMITNGYAGSGGDAMPFLFRLKKLGPLVGTTTHGILVGIYGYPVLMDGGSITSPRLGIFSTDGKWIIENEGVAPDVEVEQMPKDVINGKDPQLEKAVELVLKELKPKKEIKAPKDPVRAVN